MTDIDTSDPAALDRSELVAALHEHLAATAELPVDPTASRWLGEAEAVAADLAHGDPPPGVVSERVGHVVHLLESAGDTENDEAEAHAAAALGLARELVARGEPDG